MAITSYSSVSYTQDSPPQLDSPLDRSYVTKSNTFDEWRQFTNLLADDLTDLSSAVQTLDGIDTSSTTFTNKIYGGTFTLNATTLAGSAIFRADDSPGSGLTDSDNIIPTNAAVIDYVGAQVVAAGAITGVLGGSGLTASGSAEITLNVGTADSGRIVVNADNIDLATHGGGAVTHSAGISAITVDAYGRVTSLTAGSAVHDDLSGFVANEHVDHTSVSISSGNGLTGGGTIASTRTLAVGAGTGITVNSSDVALKNAGSLSNNTIPKWTTSSGQFANSLITDNGSTVTIGGDLSIGGSDQLLIGGGTIRYWNTNFDSPKLLSGSEFGTIIESQDAGHIVIGIRDNDSSDSFSILGGYDVVSPNNEYNTVVATFRTNGQVGIGTANPAYNLDVNGTARFTTTVRFDGQTQNFNGAYDIYRSGAGYLRHRIADQTLVIGVTNTSDTSIDSIVINPYLDTMAFSNEDGEMARFDTDGNFGIGTTTPAYKLDVIGTSKTNGNAYVGVGSGTGWFTVGVKADAGTDSTFNFDTFSGSGQPIYPGLRQGVYGFQVENGNSGSDIGTTVHIARKGTNAALRIGKNVSGDESPTDQTNGKVVEFYNNTATDASPTTTNASLVGLISINTDSTHYGTSSDYRLKENEVVISDGIARVKQLKPYRFNFLRDPDTTVDGFFAHETGAVVPEAITGEKDAVDENGDPQYQGIDQSKLVPLLTAALKEAIAKIESLEDRVTALES